MRAITVLGVLFAATTVWAGWDDPDAMYGSRVQCHLNDFNNVSETHSDPLPLTMHDGLSYLNWRHIDIAPKANMGLISTFYPNAIRAVMQEVDVASFDPKKMTMTARIQAGIYTRHFSLDAFWFACLNVSGACTLTAIGVTEDGTTLHPVTASWTGEHPSQMIYMTFPDTYVKLKDLWLLISNFGASTPDPILLISAILVCSYEIISLAEFSDRVAAQKVERELGYQWEQQRQARNVTFGHQHGGKDKKYAPGHGTEEL
ncbi:hypothetical protein LTR95_016288 [Oleoguttula sp. CCFEE 5521]